MTLVRKLLDAIQSSSGWSEAGIGRLSEEERHKLLGLMAQVESDPAVEAAEKKKWDASDHG